MYFYGVYVAFLNNIDSIIFYAEVKFFLDPVHTIPVFGSAGKKSLRFQLFTRYR